MCGDGTTDIITNTSGATIDFATYADIYLVTGNVLTGYLGYQTGNMFTFTGGLNTGTAVTYHWTLTGSDPNNALIT